MLRLKIDPGCAVLSNLIMVHGSSRNDLKQRGGAQRYFCRRDQQPRYYASIWLYLLCRGDGPAELKSRRPLVTLYNRPQLQLQRVSSFHFCKTILRTGERATSHRDEHHAAERQGRHHYGWCRE